MLKKFIFWFVTFALSFLLASVFGSQGKAFFAIHFVLAIFIGLALLTFATAGSSSRFSSITHNLTFFDILFFNGTTVFIVIATWVLSKLFGVDFFALYQIMTFAMTYAITFG